MTNYFRANYLDASAIIKILFDEPDSLRIRDYFNRPNVFRMTSLCFVEALGVLKCKYLHDQITAKGYEKRSYLLVVWVRDGRVKIDEVSLLEPQIFDEVTQIVHQYDLDISDALQIVTTKKGRYSNFGGESKSLLITADRLLAKAARSEGLLAWDCIQEPNPPDAMC